MPAALTLLLAGVLLASGAAKLRDPSGMVVLLRQALAPTVPAFALTRALAVLEVALGAVLLVGVAPRGAALAVVVLLVAFTVALRVAARRAPEAAASCSCFGGPAGAPPAQAAVRNALLVTSAAVVAAWPARTAWDLPADQLAAAVTVAAGLSCAWLLTAALVRSRGASPLPTGAGRRDRGAAR